MFEELQKDPFWRSFDNVHFETAIQDVNAAALKLDEEIHSSYKALRVLYASRFPELLTIYMSAYQFSRVVLVIGSQSDLKDSSFEGILGPSESLAVKMVSSTTIKTRSDEHLRSCLDTAKSLVEMCEMREELSNFIKDKISAIAPNLSAIVGPSIAAKLISATGGIMELARCPANNIQVIGKSLTNVGFIGECDIIDTNIPPDMQEFRKNAVRLIAAKVAMASRADVARSSADGGFGEKLRREIISKLDKLTEPSPYKIETPLPPPIIQSKKRRGGKRARKLKERTAPTQLRKQHNRIAFGATAEDEQIIGDKMIGPGMLNAGTMRITSIDPKLRNRVKKQSEKALTGIYAPRSASINPFSFDAEKALMLNKL